MTRRARPPRIAIILNASGAAARDMFAGILDYARPRSWRLVDVCDVEGVNGVIRDDVFGIVPAIRTVTLTTNLGTLADVRPDAARVRDMATEYFRRLGFRDGGIEPGDLPDFPAVPRPAACWFGSDHAAVNAVRRAVAASRRVPNDLAVLGVGNDVLTCERCEPPLSSIDLGPRRIGRLAAERLSRLLSGRDPGGPVGVPPLGVVGRASTDTLAVDDPDVAAAVRFIREHAGGPLRVGDILRASGLDRRTLERRFARHFGRSPAMAVRWTRADAAAKLLRETTLPMTAVARASGFRSPQHLAATFKAIVGQTPTDYRMSITGVLEIRDV